MAASVIVTRNEVDSARNVETALIFVFGIVVTNDVATEGNIKIWPRWNPGDEVLTVRQYGCRLDMAGSFDDTAAATWATVMRTLQTAP